MPKASGRIEPYLDRLYGYAVSLCGDPHDAKDLVQECAAKAIAARRVPEDASAYRAWLFRILRNTFLDGVRKTRFEVEMVEDNDPRDDDPAVWHCETALISGLTVKMALQKISPTHRDIISLVDIAGLSYSEAAALLDVPEGTVMSRLSRARRALMGQIATENVHPFPLAKTTKSR